MKSRTFGLTGVLIFLAASGVAAAGDAPMAGFTVKDVRGGYGFSIFGLAASAAVTHFSLALTDGGRQILMAQQDAVDVAKGVAFKQ